MVFDALRHGELDAYVDYSGTLWTTQLARDRGAPRWQILAEVEGYARRASASGAWARWGSRTPTRSRSGATPRPGSGCAALGDLAPHAGGLALGADYEFLSRREWAAVRTAYGLGFGRTASFDPALLYEAVARGEVDVISAFSSDGRIAAYDLVVLDDPAAALPSYDAMILLGPRVADDPACCARSAPLRGALPGRADASRQPPGRSRSRDSECGRGVAARSGDDHRDLRPAAPARGIGRRLDRCRTQCRRCAQWRSMPRLVAP